MNAATRMSRAGKVGWIGRRLGLLALFAALLFAAAPATPAAAAEMLWYPSSGSPTWPADGSWIGFNRQAEGLDGAVADQIDFVGSSTYPGLYYYTDTNYVYFRVRVAYTGTISSSTFRDTIWIIIDTTPSTVMPDVAIGWDSKSNDIAAHGLEMEWNPVTASIWNKLSFSDFDGDAAKKVLSPSTLPAGGYDIDLSGQGYVRTIDSVPVSSPGWNTGATTCAFVDIAVRWSYFTTYSGKLPQPATTWRIQAGSRANSTDHNDITDDIAGGVAPADTITDTGWGAKILVNNSTPTLAVVDKVRAYEAGDHALVSWQTLYESRTAGFFLERLDKDAGQWTPVNTGVIPGHFDSPAGARYSVEDQGAPAGVRVSYRLREVEVGGGEVIHGPWTVTPAGAPPASAAAKAPAAKQSATSPAVKRSATTAAGARSQQAARPDALRIETEAPGLYRLDAGALATAFGLSLTDVRTLIRKGELALSTHGEPVAVMASAAFDSLAFYAEAADGPYSRRNVYILRRGSSTLMRQDTVMPAATAPATSTPESVQAEKDEVAFTALCHDPEGDFWLWKYMVAADATQAAVELPVTTPQVLAGKRLAVSLQGLTASGTPGEHHVTVSLNGTLLGDARWDGATAKTAYFNLPAGVLRSGGNTVTLRATLDDGVPYSLVGVDSLRVDYERACLAADEQLLLHPATNGSLRVDGLALGKGVVLDVTDAHRPRLQRQVSADSAAGPAVKFAAGAGRSYLVARTAAALLPSAINGMSPATLRVPRRAGAQYIVVTAPSLVAAAQQLADLRARDGLSTLVVTTRQLYDEFADGQSTPLALRRFLAFAGSSWTVAPRYVVLAGEGSYDYRNLLGYDDALVPSLLVDTPYGLSPSDSAVGDINGDGLSEAAVGRIPAQTPAELAAYVGKLAAHQVATGAWRDRALFVAGREDDAGNFSADSRQLAAGLPSSISVETAFVAELGGPSVREKVLAEIAAGTLLVNYFGHAGVTQLDSQRLLAAADVGSMGNAPRLPVVAALTCVVGNFALPGMDGLGEALTMAQSGGASAVWAPTALTLHADSVALDKLFLAELYAPTAGGVRLGEAVWRTQRAFVAQGGSPAVASLYGLIGDPAALISH